MQFMRRLSGGTVVGILLILALPTAVGAHGPERPEDYRWVNAPEGVESAGSAESAQAEYGSELFSGGQALAWTPDLQATVSITVAAGTEVSGRTDITIHPVDPATLDPLPDSVDANGNAYEVTIDTDGWDPGVQVQLRTPYPADAMWIREGADPEWNQLSSERLATGEIIGRAPTNPDRVTVLASWNPPSHTWWQRLTHRPWLAIIPAVVAGLAGWRIGTRRLRT